MLEVKQERYMKIATLNHVQFGQIGVHGRVFDVAHLVVQERSKKHQIVYSRMQP